MDRGELLFRITRLFECILSIDAAVGVFGLDIVQQLTQDWDVHSRAIYFGSSAGHRAELRASLEKQISAIRHDEQLSPEKRFKMLADVFLHNCSIRQMPTKSIKFASSQKLLFIEVPAVDMNISDDKKVVNRAIEMTRYAILAQAVYGNSVSRYDVGEKDEKGREQLKLSIEQAVLDEYAEEQAGIVDLIHDAHIWLEGQRIGLSVDFDSLKEREDKLLGEHFPRRDR